MEITFKIELSKHIFEIFVDSVAKEGLTPDEAVTAFVLIYVGLVEELNNKQE